MCLSTHTRQVNLEKDIDKVQKGRKMKKSYTSWFGFNFALQDLHAMLNF